MAPVVDLSEGCGNRTGPAAVLVENLFDKDPGRRTYYDLLKEIRPHLRVGTVNVFGQHKERRMTAFFSTGNAPMQYSGRTLKPTRPPAGGIVEALFRRLSGEETREFFRATEPRVKLPEFNAVFVNWYRPPKAGEAPDGLGWHADDESCHESRVILAVTYASKNGERLFRMRPKRATSGCTWEKELRHQSVLVMLPGCQQAFKHCVSSRKTNLAGKKITGGRISLTFRALRTRNKMNSARSSAPQRSKQHHDSESRSHESHPERRHLPPGTGGGHGESAEPERPELRRQEGQVGDCVVARQREGPEVQQKSA